MVPRIAAGETLTCAVVGSNQAGAGTAATSKGVTVALRATATCPAAGGTAEGSALGKLALGMTRTRAENAMKPSTARYAKGKERFCVAPAPIRVGYGTTKQGRSAGKVIWITTAASHYAIHGIRPGMSVADAGRALALGSAITRGDNDWYLAASGSVTTIVKAHAGVVVEVGIAVGRLTKTAAQRQRFAARLA
jgi:hypothetical protein